MLRFYFQLHFSNREVRWGSWGFTYVINEGLWIKSEVSPGQFVVLQLLALVFLFFVYYAYKYYKVIYKNSIWMDVSFGFCANALLSNVIIDRLLFGYIRDYFINPIAISNLADFSIQIALLLIVVEVAINKNTRDLFKWDSAREDIKRISKLIEFIRDDIRRHR